MDAPNVSMISLLAKIDRSQGELYRGTGISRSVANRIVHGEWPKRRAQHYRATIIDWFEKQGATAQDIEALQCTLEKEVAPASSHLAEASPEAPATTQAHQEDSMLLRHETLTAEARQHFGLVRNPFVDDIQTRADVFQSPSTRMARAALMDCAMNHGFMALIAESGAGKSTLREDLEQRIIDENRPIIVIKPYVVEMETNDQKGTPLKSSHITEAIIATLAPAEGMKCSPQARTRQAEKLLIDSTAAGYSHLLVIEEAHRLPKSTFRHLKGFLELKRGLRRMIGVALVAQTELLGLLSAQNADMREIVQRCEVIQLRPLDNDLGEYIRHKFTRVDMRMEDVFEDDVIDAIRARLVRTPRGGKASDAISICYPLVVQNLVTRAMNAAASVGFAKVSAQVVEGC